MLGSPSLASTIYRAELKRFGIDVVVAAAGNMQIVGDPKNSAPLIAPNIPRANPNGMF